ncbi:MAG: amino acid ABC transporter substrate-binding protein [Burkholderiales bacterium]
MFLRALVAMALACAAASGLAQAPADALSPRLAQVKSGGTIRIGYRDDAIPFSYAGSGGMPMGYSIDLCRAIVDTLARDLGRESLRIEFVRVSAQDRIERVASGAVDLECGSTTITTARLARVAFSPAIFVTGTRLAVPRASGVRGFGDLQGRRVAVVAGTSNEAAMRELDRLRGLRLTFVTASGYGEAIALVAGGKADALAADEVLVRGALASRGAAQDFRIVGIPLSPEPYGIMMPRGEPMLADAAERTLRDLASSREIAWIYDRWFVRALPGGGRLDMPMSVELARSLAVLGLPPD